MADTKSSYPRIPESNWWALRDQFSKSIPANVTATYLKTLLQLTSDGAAQNLISPLKRLGIIDENNKPTERANSWRLPTTYPTACDEMLEQVYPEELRQLLNGPDVDKSRVKAWFQSSAKLGEAAADQAASLYVLLQQKVPKSLAEFRQTKSLKTTSTGKKDGTTKTNSKLRTERGTAQPELDPNIHSPAAVDKPPLTDASAVSLHIDFQIHISPEASPEQIDSIFASMAKHIGEMRKQ